jgi:hypothetical protein
MANIASIVSLAGIIRGVREYISSHRFLAIGINEKGELTSSPQKIKSSIKKIITYKRNVSDIRVAPTIHRTTLKRYSRATPFEKRAVANKRENIRTLIESGIKALLSRHALDCVYFSEDADYANEIEYIYSLINMFVSKIKNDRASGTDNLFVKAMDMENKDVIIATASVHLDQRQIERLEVKGKPYSALPMETAFSLKYSNLEAIRPDIKRK